MNLFLADSLNISIQLLFAVLVIVSLLLLGVVLMQRPKQEGLGAAFGAAITDQAFGARTTDVLKKATVYFGTAFMVLCLGLGMLINRQHVKSSKAC
ncbi:MAG: preprotein translocase subunit SecG [Akkermansia muciniphila]